MRTKRIAITGGIGVGKSTACDIISKMGYKVVSADETYKELLADKNFVKKINELLDIKSEVFDKNAVSQAVFNDREKLKTLNNEAINSQIKHLNSEFIRVYETKYRASLQSIGSTFETLELESMRGADRLLNIGVKSKIKTKKKQKKSNSK